MYVWKILKQMDNFLELKNTLVDIIHQPPKILLVISNALLPLLACLISDFRTDQISSIFVTKGFSTQPKQKLNIDYMYKSNNKKIFVSIHFLRNRFQS